MKTSKRLILVYFVRFAWSRMTHSNKPSTRLIRRWRKNLSRSPFYSKLLAQKKAFPRMNKAYFMKDFDTINTVGIKREEAFDLAIQAESTRDFSPSIDGISVGLSSGTSGNKGIFLTSEKERAAWVGAILDRVIGFKLRKRNVAFFLRANNNLYESVNSSLLRFEFFDIKTSVKGHLNRLMTLNPEILVAQPSVLVELSKLLEVTDHVLKIEKIISVAEVLEQDQKTYIEHVLNCRVDQVYQCTEGFLAHTCAKGNLHFNEDWLKIEKRFIDEDKSRFHPIITDYMRFTQPVVNFELNDIIHQGGPCSCGMKSMVIDRIEGRSDDVFRFTVNNADVVIYPDQIRRAIITSSDHVDNYLVIQKSQTQIVLSIEANSNEAGLFLKTKKALETLLSELGVKTVDIVQAEFTIESMQKFRRVRNDSSTKI